jgi:hypothetical protein
MRRGFSVGRFVCVDAMKQTLCRTDKEIFLHMFHVILDMKVTSEINESDDILMHNAVVHSVSEFPDF